MEEENFLICWYGMMMLSMHAHSTVVGDGGCGGGAGGFQKKIGGLQGSLSFVYVSLSPDLA